MKKFLVFSLSVALLALGVPGAFAARPSYVEGDALVIMNVPRAGMSVLSSQASSVASSVGAEAVGTYSEIASVTGKNIVHVRSENKTTAQLIEELKKNPAVKSAQPNYIRYLPKRTPNDPSYGELWGMVKIGMPAVWDTLTGKDSVCVAIIDTGIDYNHADLKANVAKDSQGRYGRVFFNNGSVGDDPMDRDGHGTHVAGTIGAVGDNGTGVAGVNWKVKLLAVNVFGYSDGAYTSDQLKGIQYILSERTFLNIRAVNMSLGGWDDFPDNAYKTGIESLSSAGIVVAVAAGNESQNISSPGNDPYTGENYKGMLPYPAAFKIANMITVGATDKSDSKSSFSNYSPNYVDIAAPGSNIYSTRLGGGYEFMDGTSMASPHVAGAAAILSAIFPSESAAQIKARILDGGNKSVGASFWKNGRLDVAKAAGGASPKPDPDPGPDPKPDPGPDPDPDPKPVPEPDIPPTKDDIIDWLDPEDLGNLGDDGVLIDFDNKVYINKYADGLGGNGAYITAENSGTKFYRESAVAVPIFIIESGFNASGVAHVGIDIDEDIPVGAQPVKVLSDLSCVVWGAKVSRADFASGSVSDGNWHLDESNKKLYVAIKDNSTYDIDSFPDAVMDPILLAVPTASPKPEPTPGSGGGGGCNGAFTIFASLLLVPFVLKRK